MFTHPFLQTIGLSKSDNTILVEINVTHFQNALQRKKFAKKRKNVENYAVQTHIGGVPHVHPAFPPNNKSTILPDRTLRFQSHYQGSYIDDLKIL